MATVTVTKRCFMCHQVNTIEVNKAGWDAWHRGALIQDALPELSDDERELLITGIDPECWRQLGDVE